MLSPQRLKILIAVITCCLVVVVGFYLFKSSDSSRESVRLTEIATLTNLVGEADHRRPQTLEFEPTSLGDKIYAGEMIFVRHASEATLTFTSGASIRLLPGARFVGELDSSGTAGSVLGTLIEGNAQVLNAGPQGALRLLKDGKALALATGSTSQTLAPERVPVIPQVPARSAQAANTARIETAVITATTPVETATPQPRDTRGETLGGNIAKGNGETLGNDEIRKAIRSNSGFIQRCYLTYLNRVKPEASNRVSAVTVGFVISNSGKVRDAKIVRSDFQDATLNNCILETLERTSFRAFRGNDIPVLEFPIELQ